jgi:hypothetical protein
MLKTLEKITVSTQVYPTTTSAISGSSALDMSTYRHAVCQLFAHRLPDALGEGVITLSLYETTNTTLNGQEVASSVVTGSITSASDVYLEAEIDTTDMDTADGYRYLYPYVVSATGTVVASTVVRDEKRYEV